MPTDPNNITHLVQEVRLGKTDALEALMSLLYDELRALANHKLRDERTGHTLNATALVNEVYLRFVSQDRLNVHDRGQFFAVAGATMRRILVDYARMKKRQKRGGGAQHLSLDEATAIRVEDDADEILALDEALSRLESINPRGSAIVQHRFFSGLTLDEIASLMGLSAKTVHRSWQAARAWLRKEVGLSLAS